MNLWIFLTETVKKQFFIATGGIERSRDRFYLRVIVLHVVGEHHNLRYIRKASKGLLLKSAVDSLVLRNDSVPVIGLFDLNKSQGQAIDQERDIRPKFIISVSIRKFCDNMVCIS